MTAKKSILALVIMLVAANCSVFSQSIKYTMPGEDQTHEGTWLQWPHQYQYGSAYRNSLDATWVAMTQQLVTSEKVHIIAYNTSEKNRIISKLNAGGVPLANVDFKIFKTNDVWVRDNGPIYVLDNSGQLKIEDWGFNGWGNKAGYGKCNIIPKSIATANGTAVVNLNSTMTVEGGAYIIDGNGVFMACKSSILNSNRNPGMTQAQVESILKINLGVTKFIWLDGVAGLEITDMHIDGFAMFANSTTIVTMNTADLLYWDVPQADITKLYAATQKNNVPYNFVYLPLTQNNVVTTSGKNLGYKGSYANFYIANNKVLVPAYNDPKDIVAQNILQALYPTKTVVGIDCRNLYENGGMIHCVTQQQPANNLLKVSAVVEVDNNTDKTIATNLHENTAIVFPNPATFEIEIATGFENSSIEIYNNTGQSVFLINSYNRGSKIPVMNLLPGVYFIKCYNNDNKLEVKYVKFIKQ